MERISSSDNSAMSRPWNLIRPPTIFPTLERSRMMPSETVDLPQPDSPTMPIASPGMTVQEKSITAGISPARVKKEMERFSISRIGLAPSVAAVLRAWFMASILQRLFAQRVGQEIEPQHEGHQRDDRRQGRVDIGAEQPAGILDRRAPVRAFGCQSQAEIAERAEQDRGVADPEAHIDDERPARIGQHLPQHDVPGTLASRLSSGHIVARLDVHGEAAHDAEDAGRGG